jgi:hypothetical protein
MSEDSLQDAEDGGATTVAEPRSVQPAKAPRRHLSMAVVNFCLDAILLAILTLYGWVAVMLPVVFPAPSSAAGWSLWGWNIDQWWDFQFAILCAFAVAVLVHVMLHWNWVCSVVMNQVFRTRRRIDDSMQTIYGVETLIILLHLMAAGLIAALWSVQKPPG